MKDELVLAPSAGRSPISFTFSFTEAWSSSEQVDSTAWCNPYGDSWFRNHLQTHGHVLKRVRGGRTGSVNDLPLLSQGTGWIVFIPHTNSILYPTHTESHIAPDTSRACSKHTSCVHTRPSLWSSAAVQRCSAILLRRVINYSLKISALVQS